MKLKNLIISAFIIVAFIQLYVPAKMILDNEDVIKTGTVYKFKTQPIDPNDPFRGKYIVLRYEARNFKISNPNYWKRNEEVYVEFLINEDGYAKIKAITKKKPTHTSAYVITKVDYVHNNSIGINYPFNRYYMEESKAYEAEVVYRDAQRDGLQTTYALVSIKNGAAVLKDVLINEVSIREIVKQRQNSRKE